jgi:hypothetical protein
MRANKGRTYPAGSGPPSLYNDPMTGRDRRLVDTAKRTTSVNWPEAVDRRLDRLLELAEEAGEQTSRAQILAALVCQAPLDGEGLGVQVRAYRRIAWADFDQRTGPVPPPAPRRGRRRQDAGKT